jgi:hypothetical protein
MSRRGPCQCTSTAPPLRPHGLPSAARLPLQQLLSQRHASAQRRGAVAAPHSPRRRLALAAASGAATHGPPSCSRPTCQAHAAGSGIRHALQAVASVGGRVGPAAPATPCRRREQAAAAVRLAASRCTAASDPHAADHNPKTTTSSPLSPTAAVSAAAATPESIAAAIAASRARRSLQLRYHCPACAIATATPMNMAAHVARCACVCLCMRGLGTRAATHLRAAPLRLLLRDASRPALEGSLDHTAHVSSLLQT